jgi:hypothetical protein
MEMEGLSMDVTKLPWLPDKKPKLPLHSRTSTDSSSQSSYISRYAYTLFVSFLLFGSLWNRGVIYRWYKGRGYFYEDHTMHTTTTRNPAYLIEAKHGAVASENKRCSKIGVDVMKEGGNAVDAAIATTFCVGVVNMFSYVRRPTHLQIVQFTTNSIVQE